MYKNLKERLDKAFEEFTGDDMASYERCLKAMFDDEASEVMRSYRLVNKLLVVQSEMYENMYDVPKNYFVIISKLNGKDVALLNGDLDQIEMNMELSGVFRIHKAFKFDEETEYYKVVDAAIHEADNILGFSLEIGGDKIERIEERGMGV